MKGTHKIQLLIGRSGEKFVKVTSHSCPDICVVEKIEKEKKAIQKLRILERAANGYG